LEEQGVLAVVRGPDSYVVAEGGAALGGFPQQTGVGVFGEFVEADVAAVNGHGLGVGGEGDDAGAGVEFDDADFDFVGEAAGTAAGVEARDLDGLFAAGEDGFGEVKEVSELPDELHVFEGAGIIFGGEEVIAFFEAESFADVFEGVAVRPADADGFFGEGADLLALGVERVLGFDPVDLVEGEVGANMEERSSWRVGRMALIFLTANGRELTRIDRNI